MTRSSYGDLMQHYRQRVRSLSAWGGQKSWVASAKKNIIVFDALGPAHVLAFCESFGGLTRIGTGEIWCRR